MSAVKRMSELLRRWFVSPRRRGTDTLCCVPRCETRGSILVHASEAGTIMMCAPHAREWVEWRRSAQGTQHQGEELLQALTAWIDRYSQADTDQRHDSSKS